MHRYIKNKNWIAIIAIILLTFTGQLLIAQPQSNHFILKKWGSTQGSSNSTATHFQLVSVVGQSSPPGQMDSDHYSLISGLLHPGEGGCIPACQGISENEPYFAGPDVINGGCNSSPPVFMNILCGDTVCGTGFTFSIPPYNYRDTDWYKITLTEPSSISWQVQAEYPVQIFIADGTYGCSYPGYITAAGADSCQTAIIETDCLPPADYWLFAAPSTFTGIPTPKPDFLVVSCDSCQACEPCLIAEDLQFDLAISDSNSDGCDYWATYPHCGGYSETGPEKVYQFDINYDGTILTAALSDLQADLDILLLDSCHYGSCIGGADDTLTITLDQGEYFLVIDGFQDAVSPYTLFVTAETPTPPTPQVVIQVVDSADIALSWSVSEPVDSFYVYRDTDPTFTPSPTSLTAATDTTYYLDEDVLIAGALTYFYQVTAVRVATDNGAATAGQESQTIIPSVFGNRNSFNWSSRKIEPK